MSDDLKKVMDMIQALSNNMNKRFELVDNQFDSVNGEIKSVRQELTELRPEVRTLANQNGVEHQQMMQAIKD